MNKFKANRDFLKSGDWDQWEKTKTDQRRKIPMPDLQKEYSADAKKIELINYEDFVIGKMSLLEVINQRRSRRRYTMDELTLEELSYLLWATQGVKKGNRALRTVPSGGARHSFETYLHIQRVMDIEPGLYRYLPLEHKLLFLAEDHDLVERITEACNSQEFVRDSAVTFIWTTIPYRSEWRYDILSHKVIALDAGHLCQNLYLASEAIHCGTCAIGAYSQEKMDRILGLDGENEFTIYIAPVGRVE